MINILLAATISLFLVLLGTPLAIRFLRQRNLGQYIREDGPEAHFAKQGTPTMGGLVIIGGAIAGYLLAHIRPQEIFAPSARPIFLMPNSSGLISIATICAMASLGFVDDFLKVSKRRSLGLNKSAKLLGQLAIAIGFAWAATLFDTQAETQISFVRPLGISLDFDLNVLFVAWVFLIFASASNGVNLADGLDGLACGSGAMVMGAYVVIAFWQVRHLCPAVTGGCYDAPHSLDIAMVAASMLGAAAGFLWWNAAPAKIFMGDTGSLAIGGAMASLAMMTNTQLLLIVLGGLYVVEVTSVVMQVVSFRLFKRRMFLMAPIHHHFELRGWPEFTVIVRFWILSALSIAFALGLFYYDFIRLGGAD
ncbi:MAG TPA: phospho-N-acetylmuramoyl-pentapeptide-transferase [Actinomycetota bacterium]|nr:phospho-N-acetylmuramoyl-pentapeptide-transferase [Actinomycetota bacterium]